MGLPQRRRTVCLRLLQVHVKAVVLFQQLERQLRSSCYILPVVVDVVRCHDPMAIDGDLPLFDAEGFARRVEAVAAVGQHECQRPQIEEMPAELLVLRFASF